MCWLIPQLTDKGVQQHLPCICFCYQCISHDILISRMINVSHGSQGTGRVFNIMLQHKTLNILLQKMFDVSQIATDVLFASAAPGISRTLLSVCVKRSMVDYSLFLFTSDNILLTKNTNSLSCSATRVLLESTVDVVFLKGQS